MTDWFLPAGGPGSPDEWCFQAVPTTEVRVHVDYHGYYDRLADLFAQAKTNDEILLVGWGFGLEETIKKDKSALFFLEAARGRGARVRLLATPKHQWSDNATQVSNAVAKKLDAMIDDQLPVGGGYYLALHHQKAVFIKLESSSHLFVGGMDVTTGRIDEWFDVQAEVVGLGASLGRKTLEERWESLKPPLGGVSATQQALPPAKGDAHQVQFVRTYPPFPQNTTNWKRNYAKDGDHTCYALLCRAIASAKKTIYLEEQFFQAMGPAPTRNNPAGGSSPRQRSDVPDVPDTLDRLLKDAIGRGVKVVVVAANKVRPIPPPDPAARDALVRSLASTTNPPVLLQAHPDMMFVHSKTWVFDDEFMLVGSGNFWPRSLTSVGAPAEAEFAVAFTSKADGVSLGFAKVPFARALRVRLWERLRQDRDPNYTFPRNAAASFDDEVKELRKPIAGSDPFEVMA